MNASHECLIIISWMQLRARSMVRLTLFGFAVTDVEIQRNKIDVVHCHIIALRPADEVAHVDQRTPVESKNQKGDKGLYRMNASQKGLIMITLYHPFDF